MSEIKIDRAQVDRKVRLLTEPTGLDYERFQRSHELAIGSIAGSEGAALIAGETQ